MPPTHERAFHDAVMTAVRALPAGVVATYGEVAAEAGYPGAARGVGSVLGTTDQDVPWWRVVTATGRLVPGHEAEHRRLLAAEGVALTDRGVAMRPNR